MVTDQMKAISNLLMSDMRDLAFVDIQGDHPQDGYMVGGYSPIQFMWDDDPMYTWTDQFLERNWYLMGEDDKYIGKQSHADGSIEVQVYRYVADLYTAVALAESRNQDYVWDVASGKEVWTGWDN